MKLLFLKILGKRHKKRENFIDSFLHSNNLKLGLNNDVNNLKLEIRNKKENFENIVIGSENVLNARIVLERQDAIVKIADRSFIGGSLIVSAKK